MSLVECRKNLGVLYALIRGQRQATTNDGRDLLDHYPNDWFSNLRNETGDANLLQTKRGGVKANRKVDENGSYVGDFDCDPLVFDQLVNLCWSYFS